MVDFSNNEMDIDLLAYYIENDPEFLFRKPKEEKTEPSNYVTEPEDYPVQKPDVTLSMPSLPIQRVPSHILGNGVLGRCYVGTTLIQIRDDLYGDDFNEVDIHELKHALNPYLQEYYVRFWTRAMLGNTKYN